VIRLSWPLRSHNHLAGNIAEILSRSVCPSGHGTDVSLHTLAAKVDDSLSVALKCRYNNDQIPARSESHRIIVVMDLQASEIRKVNNMRGTIRSSRIDTSCHVPKGMAIADDLHHQVWVLFEEIARSASSSGAKKLVDSQVISLRQLYQRCADTNGKGATNNKDEIMERMVSIPRLSCARSKIMNYTREKESAMKHWLLSSEYHRYSSSLFIKISDESSCLVSIRLRAQHHHLLLFTVCTYIDQANNNAAWQ
jgi:hypothetical protein